MANKTITGVVSMVSGKDWEDRDTGEDIVLWSFQIEGDKRYFRTGTDEPEIDEGDALRFVFNTKGNNVDFESIEIIDASEVEAAPKPRRSSRSGNSNKRGGAGRKTRSSGGSKKSGGEDWNARQKYWENKEKRDVEVVEPRITYAAAQRDAVSVVTAALANDALSFGNSAKGARLDMLLDFVDNVAAKFFDQRINITLAGPNAEADDGDYDE